MTAAASTQREILYKRLDDALTEIGDNDPEHWKLVKYSKWKRGRFIKDIDIYPVFEDRKIIEREGKCICGVSIDKRYHIYNEKLNTETVIGCVCIETILGAKILTFPCLSCSRRFNLTEDKMATHMCGHCTKRHTRPCNVCERDHLLFGRPRGICETCEEGYYDYAICTVCGKKETGSVGYFEDIHVCKVCEKKPKRRPLSRGWEPTCEDCHKILTSDKFKKCFECNKARFDSSCSSCGKRFCSHRGRYKLCYSCSKK